MASLHRTDLITYNLKSSSIRRIKCIQFESLESQNGKISISFYRESRTSDTTYTCEGAIQTMGIPVAVFVNAPLGFLKGKGATRHVWGWTEGESRFLWQNDESTHQIIDFVLQCLEGTFHQSEWFSKSNWFSKFLKGINSDK